MDKPTKPTDLIPRSFGGVKNNFSPSLQSSGYEDGVPAIYGGDNLNYQLDATGKELDYCEKICDYINAIPINKTPIVDANNKLVYTQYDIRVYNAAETYYENDYLSGFVDGEKHIYRCKQDNVTGQALSNDTYFERVDIMGNVKTIGRNIGEIVSSTLPLTDAGLHLLDGALIQGGGIYSAFVDYIASIYDASASYFCSESDWQTEVISTGSCDKYVYNSENNTVRLPKIGNQLIHSLPSTLGVKGNGNNIGLTNGASTPTYVGLGSNNGLLGITTGNYGVTLPNSGGQEGGLLTGQAVGLTPDTTKSGIVTDTSKIVGADVYYYVVIATTTKTEIEVDIDEVATDLAGKADIDLSNINPTQTVKNTIINWGIPDYSTGVQVSSGYTATYDGIVLFSLTEYLGDSGAYGEINGVRVAEHIGVGGGAGIVTRITLPFFIKKGDVITYSYYGQLATATAYVYKLTGGN